MDNRKLNTADVLASGILGKNPLKSRASDDVEYHDVEEGEWSVEGLREGLERGGLKAAMYYGCWRIWKSDDGFSGELFQYRERTDGFDNQSLDEALVKAIEWASGCGG